MDHRKRLLARDAIFELHVRGVDDSDSSIGLVAQRSAQQRARRAVASRDQRGVSRNLSPDPMARKVTRPMTQERCY